MAGGAKGDEKAGLMAARPAMVDRKLAFAATGLTAVVVSEEDLLALAAKAAAGVGLAGIAAGAESGAEEPHLATLAEET